MFLWTAVNIIFGFKNIFKELVDYRTALLLS